MGSNINGFLNEKEMVNYLNNKKIIDLNSNMCAFIKWIFGNISLNDVIHADKIGGQLKPDCFVEINGIKKNISLKMGSGNSIHQEPLNDFCDFLQDNGVSQNSINTLRLFNYADGTVDGTGKKRINAFEFCNQNANKVILLNNEINQNKNLLAKLFDRFLFVGVDYKNPKVDIAYHGTIDNGLWTTREEIIDYLLTSNMPHKGIYFSSLSYQVWNRCLNYNQKTENRRHVMQIKWSSMTKDVLEIISRRKR